MTRPLHALAFLAVLVLFSAAVVDKTAPPPVTQDTSMYPGEALFFDLEVRDAEGDVVARPRLVGKAGRRTQIHWSAPESDDAPMCIVLDPLAAQDGLDMSVDLSVDGRTEHRRSRLAMPMRGRWSFSVATEEGVFDVSLLAYRVDSPEFETYLERMRSRVLAARAPEA